MSQAAFMRFLAATGSPETDASRQMRERMEKSGAAFERDMRFNVGVARRAMVLSEIFGQPVSKRRKR